MKKSTIIYLIIITILSIALVVMSFIMYKFIEIAKNNFNLVMTAAEENYKSNLKIQELEEELEKYKNTTTSYVPDGMSIANENYSGQTPSDSESTRTPNNVTIEVIENTITNKSVEILITDNNEPDYGWGKSYRIQKNDNGTWIDLDPITDLAFEEIAYVLNENNQLTQKINWETFYGILEKGTYRIVKPVYDNKYIDLYSNEFEIK